MFLPNTKVTLRRFNGTQLPPSDCAPQDNYWRLIGESGTVITAADARHRVLVQFDVPVNERGLACHNPVPNSLYILASDLEAAG